MEINKETKWVVGSMAALLVLTGVGAIGWWAGAHSQPVETRPIPLAASPAPQVAAPRVAVPPAEQPQAQVNRFNNANGAQNRQQAMDAMRQQMQQAVQNLQNNMSVDPQNNTMTFNGPNGAVQIPLPPNLQMTPGADGRPQIVLNGQAIGLGGFGGQGGGGFVQPGGMGLGNFNGGGAGGAQITGGLQAQILATNEEWKVIGPLLTQVVADRQMVDAATGGGTNNAIGLLQLVAGRTGMGNDAFGGPGDTAAGAGFGGRFFGGQGGGPGGPQNFNVAAGIGAPGNAMLANGAAGGGPADAAAAPVPADQAQETVQVITVSQSLADLRKALADSTTPQDKLQQLTDTYHAAREKARKELQESQRELVQILTPQQEAILLAMGYID